MLEAAVDEEDGGGAEELGVFFEALGAHDDVDHAGFVFEGDEEEALGRAGALAADDYAAHADAAAVLLVSEMVGADDATAVHFTAEVLHGVAEGGGAGGGVVVEDFLGGVEGVARGEPALTPLLARKLLHEFKSPKTATPKEEDPDALTAREMEVLEWMVQGVTSNRSLARKLGVSENTVKFHVRNILDKFHLHNRAQVVSYALRSGIVVPDAEI